MKGIKIIENRSEIGAGTRGSSLGVDALKLASVNLKSDYFSNIQSTALTTENHCLFEENPTPNAIYIEGVIKIYDRMAQAIDEHLREDYFPLVLAADHASAGGTIAGLKKHFPDKKIGVVWIDAHGDLHSPYTSPTGNIHGMPLATALNEDNLECKIKEISKEEKNYWEQLKRTAGVQPKIQSENLVFYGVRDTEYPENQLISRNNIKSIGVEESRSRGIEQVAKEGLDHLSDCDYIYVSFDVDSMDPDLSSYGTGTPVPNGYSPEEAKALIQHLMASKKVVCFEMVEVNPLLDEKKNRMAEIAFKILEETTKSIEKYSLS